MSDVNVILKVQIEKTIEILQLALQVSSEQAVAEYLGKYKHALALISAGGVNSEALIKALRALLGCARGYMETSSNYDQKFLDEMGLTEKLVKDLLG